MKKAGTAYIEIGKIGSPYGVQGWLKVHSYTESYDSILSYAPWRLVDQNNSNELMVEIEESRDHGKGLIVKFIGINTPEDARQLTGKIITIARSQLPVLGKNEFYWSDLEGLTVINKNGDILGKVIYLMATGSNDVLIVKGAKEHAIPFLLNTIILNVDLKKQEIHVDWDAI